MVSRTEPKVSLQEWLGGQNGSRGGRGWLYMYLEEVSLQKWMVGQNGDRRGEREWLSLQE